MSAILGGASVGFVWGWLFGGITVPRRLAQAAALALVLIGLVAEAYLLAGTHAVLALLAAMGVGIVLQAAWLAALRRKDDHTRQVMHE